jgi:hypothetical protein
VWRARATVLSADGAASVPEQEDIPLTLCLVHEPDGRHTLGCRVPLPDHLAGASARRCRAFLLEPEAVAKLTAITGGPWAAAFRPETVRATFEVARVLAAAPEMEGAICPDRPEAVFGRVPVQDFFDALPPRAEPLGVVIVVDAADKPKSLTPAPEPRHEESADERGFAAAVAAFLGGDRGGLETICSLGLAFLKSRRGYLAHHGLRKSHLQDDVIIDTAALIPDVIGRLTARGAGIHPPSLHEFHGVLMGAMRRTAAKAHQAETRHWHERLPALPQEDTAFAALEATDSVEAAHRCLSEDEWKLIEWRFMENLTEQEIADRLGRPTWDVRRELGQVAHRLRERLRHETGANQP